MMTERDLKILLGVLSEPPSGPSLGHQDGCWTLFVIDEFGEPEVMCRHEDWDQFIELCGEYTDYVEGE